MSFAKSSPRISFGCDWPSSGVWVIRSLNAGIMLFGEGTNELIEVHRSI